MRWGSEALSKRFIAVTTALSLLPVPCQAGLRFFVQNETIAQVSDCGFDIAFAEIPIDFPAMTFISVTRPGENPNFLAVVASVRLSRMRGRIPLSIGIGAAGAVAAIIMDATVAEMERNRQAMFKTIDGVEFSTAQVFYETVTKAILGSYDPDRDFDRLTENEVEEPHELDALLAESGENPNPEELFSDLGVLVAAAGKKGLKNTIRRKPAPLAPKAPYSRVQLDKLALNYFTSLRLASLSMLHKDGKLFTSWSLAHAAQISNRFHGAMIDSLKYYAKQPRSNSRDIEMKLLLKYFKNPALREINQWLAFLTARVRTARATVDIDS